MHPHVVIGRKTSRSLLLVFNFTHSSGLPLGRFSVACSGLFPWCELTHHSKLNVIPLVWPELEEAMMTNTSLRFVHKYHYREEDASILQYPFRLVVVSALKSGYTKLVIDRSCASS